MNLNKNEMILYLIPDAVDFIGIENKLPKNYKTKINLSIRKYELPPDGKHDTYVTTDKQNKKNALRK
jgi:hypothetical protein